MRKLLVLGLAQLILASSALAQAPAPAPFPLPLNTRGTDEDQRACQRDAVTLCKSVLGDDMAVLSCFQSHRPKLSVSCRRVLEKYGQ